MDETKDTTKDSLPQGKAPEGSEGITPKDQTKTYTEEEVKQREATAVQSALIKAGRDNKSLELKTQALTEKEEAVNAAQAEVDKILGELGALKDNPGAVDWVQKNKELQEAEKTLKKDKSEFAREKAEYAGQLKVLQEENREKSIWGIAAKFTTEPAEMADLFVKLSKLNIEDMKQLEELAETITSAKPKEQIKVDSGVTSGGKPLPESAKAKIKAGWEEKHK